jgi:hypothetical protein
LRQFGRPCGDRAAARSKKLFRIGKILNVAGPGTMAAWLADALRRRPVGVTSRRMVGAPTRRADPRRRIPMKNPKVLVTLTALMSAYSLACDKPGVTERQREQQAEKSVTLARADFETTRENYLHTRKLELIDLDRRISDLEAASASGTGKADLRARLAVIDARREAFGRHFGMMEAAPSTTWDAATKDLDQEWDALRMAVDAAA